MNLEQKHTRTCQMSHVRCHMYFDHCPSSSCGIIHAHNPQQFLPMSANDPPSGLTRSALERKSYGMVRLGALHAILTVLFGFCLMLEQLDYQTHTRSFTPSLQS